MSLSGNDSADGTSSASTTYTNLTPPGLLFTTVDLDEVLSSYLYRLMYGACSLSTEPEPAAEHRDRDLDEVSDSWLYRPRSNPKPDTDRILEELTSLRQELRADRAVFTKFIQDSEEERKLVIELLAKISPKVEENIPVFISEILLLKIVPVVWPLVLSISCDTLNPKSWDYYGDVHFPGVGLVQWATCNSKASDQIIEFANLWLHPGPTNIEMSSGWVGTSACHTLQLHSASVAQALTTGKSSLLKSSTGDYCPAPNWLAVSYVDAMFMQINSMLWSSTYHLRDCGNNAALK
ncbi:hypothetical protein K435DRAFT_803624 [Dendrothele bispora CBS 962.96]|uniref:Uncharacterized protein n=1 Tax=Dendrothele bispora (strain CBS 962.96) TaxID=1314807 RepID=A0A4S8LGZ1_DENBC|nr:hypothetical protein K435DRAFT_803624 [Dendrothele bispora CBS 962.96]